MENKIHRHINCSRPLSAITIDIADVQKIFEKLDAKCKKDGWDELDKLQKMEDETPEEHSARIRKLHEELFHVSVFIYGDDGSCIIGEDSNIFSFVNLPSKISRIYMTNTLAYRTQIDRDPLNRFELTLDFSRPPIVDTNQIASAPTINNSTINSIGDEEYVNVVVAHVVDLERNRQNNRKSFHSGFSYEVGLLVFGFPFTLSACWTASDTIDRIVSITHSFLGVIFYVYLVIFCLNLYRVIVGYMRWLFPLVELRQNRSFGTMHKAFWAAIVTTLAGNIIWSIATNL
ncbi:MAG: hypothetical protein KDA49_08955 [Rhodospirillaceae bacterium]|nr:hypothetical protein [Rhodospirillaceae bacterium]